MCEKGQGLGKERERSLQDTRDAVGFVVGAPQFWESGGGDDGGGGILAERSHLGGPERHPVSIREQC